LQDSLELDAQTLRGSSHGYLAPLSNDIDGHGYLLDNEDGRRSSSASSADTLTVGRGGLVRSYWEMWDYQGGCRFRGFVAEGQHETGMFVFFDEKAFGHGLKAGMMALIDLCDAHGINCSSIYVCLDRRLNDNDYASLMKDLRWVGFEPTTLADWTIYEDITSNRWTLLSMEVE